MKKIYLPFLFLTVSLLSAEDNFQSRAVIHSLERTILSSEIAGKIIFIPKSNGDYFEKNEILAKIDCDIYTAERDKNRVKKDLQKVKYDKMVHLNSFNSAGQLEVKTAELELQEQELELKIASMNVNRCEVKAPFTGRIVEKKANQYQNIKPQEELFEIVNNNAIEIKTVVPAQWLSWLKVGQEININIDELNIDVKSKILQIDSVVDPKSQTINLRAKIENNQKIIAGMSGTLTFMRK